MPMMLYIRIFFLTYGHKDSLLVFSSKSFIFLHYLIPWFILNWILHKVWHKLTFFIWMFSFSSTTYCKDCVLCFDLPCLFFFKLWTLCSIQLIYVSSLWPVSSPSHDYCCFIICLKKGLINPSTLFFFFRIILAILGPLHFHENFIIILFLQKFLLRLWFLRICSSLLGDLRSYQDWVFQSMNIAYLFTNLGLPGFLISVS